MLDGFWLPRGVREQILELRSGFVTTSFARGRPVAAGQEGAVTVRWPELRAEAWPQLLTLLGRNREQAPHGEAYWERLSGAMEAITRRLADPGDALHRTILESVPGYTGYSQAMIAATLQALDLWNLEQFPAAFKLEPTWQAVGGWQAMDGLPSRLRFTQGRGSGLRARLPGRGGPLFGAPAPADVVLGYGAGNVPGTALLIAFLALSTALVGRKPPAVVVKNSRREPIFAPLVLSALEEADEGLVSTLAVLIWDYEDEAAQAPLLGRAGLAIAAASDQTIGHIRSALERLAAPDARFHAHGHKVSFSAIGREVLDRGLQAGDGIPLLDAVALLAALDSIYWDQHGCLSSRMHFVEAGGAQGHTSLEYAARLAEQFGRLGSVLPRGAWPRQRLHDRFDRYKFLESTGRVRVLSSYDDEFLVIHDARPLDAPGLQSTVNDCEGRVVVVRPVEDLLAIPEAHLRLLPAGNLQSLSVAVGREGQGLRDEFLQFAAACAARGVTAIRSVGRGAFPQLAYSWDGLLPLDLLRRRPEGWFTTIEFDSPYDEMLATYRLAAALDKAAQV
jgi:hypothetical protein